MHLVRVAKKNQLGKRDRRITGVGGGTGRKTGYQSKVKKGGREGVDTVGNTDHGGKKRVRWDGGGPS